VIAVEDVEHLQLTLAEAFFLSYALGALRILDPTSSTAIPVSELLPLFRTSRSPDDPFLLSYVAYHHYRSLGWVVKSGSKFAVDYLLYERGPAFRHAEFAIVLLPAYDESYDEETKRRATKPWYWLHNINRVCTHVQKTLILTYVRIPPLADFAADDENTPIDTILKRYSIREVSIRRFIPDRNRD